MVWLWVGLGVLGLIDLLMALAAIGGGMRALQMATQPAEGGVNFMAATASMLLVVGMWLRVLAVLLLAVVLVLVALVLK